VGILGYLVGKPVAWCSIAPRPTYRNLGGVAGAADENVWSLACFFVTRQYRGQGMTARLIGAAVDHARARGATVVEAYPVDPDSPSYRFMGFVAAFKKAGFVEAGRAGTRRRVMRLQLEAQ
jgi:GNAT superfamily N-acetyltransferase